MGPVQPVRHDVLAAHGSIIRPRVPVITCLTLRLFPLRGCSHTRDRDLQWHDRLYRLSESHLDGPPDLTTIYAGGHDSAESAYVEEVGAHKVLQLDRFVVILRIELCLLADLVIIGADCLVGLAMLFIEDRAFLNVDSKARRIGPRELEIVPDLALEAYVTDETTVGLWIEPRQVPGIGIAVRVAVCNIEKKDEVIAIVERVHAVSPSLFVFSFFRGLKNSLRWW